MFNNFVELSICIGKHGSDLVLMVAPPHTTKERGAALALVLFVGLTYFYRPFIHSIHDVNMWDYLRLLLTKAGMTPMYERPSQ